ncbi:MAG: DNA polymerase III subunit delta [Ignavibacteriaceae bacterium]
MAKSKSGALNILDAIKDLNNKKILPVYYFFGVDSFNIEAALKAVEQAVQPFIGSDFDKESFYGEDKNLADVLSFASAFPFGSEKKLIIFKEFEKVKDKKTLAAYSESPPDFTVLVLIHNGAITNQDSEPFRTLSKNGFLYEAKELKGNNLKEWLISFAETKGKNLSRENAQLLMDISGENRSMLEAQLDKMFTFLGDSKEITFDVIKALSTSLKEYTIFDLQNAIAKKDKASSLKVAFNMLEKGSGATLIVHMLTRYFTGLARVNELKAQNIPDQAAARIVGTHPFYYKDYQKARSIYSDKNIAEAVRALLKADISIKTTSMDEKTVISLLIAEIIN